MFFPQIKSEDWAKRYRLQPFSEECEHCGRLQTTDIPWASGKWRGLKSTVCTCGSGCDIATAVQISVNDADEWKKIFNTLIEQTF